MSLVSALFKLIPLTGSSCRWRLRWALAPLLAASVTAAAADTILVLGDSISAAYGLPREQGWVALLAQQMPEHTIVNASISGETTEGGLQRLPQLLERHQPDVLIIELGGNDGLRGFPLQRLRANLSSMTELGQAAGARVLLVGMKIPPNYGPRYTSGFEQAFIDTAAQYETALVPFFLERVAAEPGMMQDDGIHPTAAAQQRLLENMLPQLEALLKAPSS
ncbi:MAG: arylesterase [Spongiibacteraceae bacterium]|nr:arylesterase [Spongiibacteraceae bacterium]